MNPTCSTIILSDDNASNVVEYVEKVSDGIVVHNPGGQTIILQDFNSISPTTPSSACDKVTIATFDAYTACTQINFNNYTGTTSAEITSRLLITDFNFYVNVTEPNIYYNKIQINSYTGTTIADINSRLLTTIFNFYTGTTAPVTYETIANFNFYTGTTAPNTYLGISATAVNSFALCGCVPSCFLGATTCAVDSAKLGNQLPSFYMPATVGLTGGTNGIGTINQNACLGGMLISNTCIIGNQALCLGTAISKLASLDLHSLGNTCLETGSLTISSSGATFTDLNAIACGIVYNSDYSINYVPRSLVDKGYVDSVAAGLNIHIAVVAATTSGITLSGSPKYIDGIYLTNGMRVLVKNQGTGITGSTANGIYVITGTTWSRASDYNSSPQVSNGDLIPVTSGLTQNNSLWALASQNPITVGVTPLIFTEFSTIIDVQAGVGIAVTQVGGVHTVCVQLGTCSSTGCGLAVDINGLCVNSNIAGSGLTYNSGILNVNAALGGAISAIPIKLNTSCCLVVNCADITGITVNNSLRLGGNLANTYAPLAAPSFTGQVSIGGPACGSFALTLAGCACATVFFNAPTFIGTTLQGNNIYPATNVDLCIGSRTGVGNRAIIIKSVGVTPTESARWDCTGAMIACYSIKAPVFIEGSTCLASTYSTLLAPISIKTGTTYTLQVSDSGKILEFTNTGTTNITLPSGVTFSQGFQVVITNIGGGNKCLVAGTGASIHTLGSKIIIAGAYNAVSVYYSSTNNWVAFGNLC